MSLTRFKRPSLKDKLLAQELAAKDTPTPKAVKKVKGKRLSKLKKR